MQIKDTIELALGIAAFFGSIFSFFFWLIYSKFGAMTESVDALNKNVAIVIEKVSFHEKILDRHEEQIQKLHEVN